MSALQSKERNIWWNRYKVYVVSSLCIIVVMLFVLYLKKYWPFGEASFMSGDFIPQGWAYAVALKEKIINGDSLFYTWGAGYGTNYYSNLAFYMNPFMLLFAFVPSDAVLQTSTITYILTLVLCNISMLYFLTHRPEHALPQSDFSNMLFSLAFSFCMYIVSNTINWNFLITAVCFPIIILGLENYVSGKGFWLYVISLAIAFFSNYYFTGLFCIFIVLYYFTLHFKSFKHFLVLSCKILALSIMAIGVSGVVIIPVAVQLLSQSYSVSGYEGGIWFTNYFDIIQNYFAFNKAIDIGTTAESYGEVNLYYGLLPLMLTTMYFFNSQIPLKQRLKKLCVWMIYMLAFNLNILNYVMHMFHYPSWFPNRFSLFFTMYCIILAYDSWSLMLQKKKESTMLKSLIAGLLWSIMTVLCMIFAEKAVYQFVYYYSIIIYIVYMVILMFLPYWKKLLKRGLVVIGCIEIIFCFSYAIIFRDVIVSVDISNNKLDEYEAMFNNHASERSNGFSRTLPVRDVYGEINSGMMLNYPSPTIFSSSINNTGDFLSRVGVYCGSNNFLGFTYTPASMSMLNVEYLYFDSCILNTHVYEQVFTLRDNIYDGYPLIYEKDTVTMYKNPTVLSLGYMIQQDVSFQREDTDIAANMNQWIMNASGVDEVLQGADLQAVDLETENCQAVLIGNDLMISHRLREDFLYGMDFSLPGNFKEIDMDAYDETSDSYITITYAAEKNGEYYIQIDDELCSSGYMEQGEEFCVMYKADSENLEAPIYEAKVRIFYFDEEKWSEAYEALKQEQLQVTDYSDNTIEGTISLEKEGILFTSIPYDSSWHVYVDGECETIVPLCNNTFIGIKLEPGTHTIQFVYRQKGLRIGILITIVSLVAMVFIFFMNKKRERQ